MHFPRACASASISPQRKISSGLTGPTKSLPAPTRSLTTTGHPQQLASLTTTANGSYSEGNTIKSAAVYTPGSCDWFTNPKNRTRSLIPSEAALLSSSPRKCPSPAYTNIAPDRSVAESRANACSTSAGRFHACSLAQNRITTWSGVAFQSLRTAARSTSFARAVHQSLSTTNGVSVIRSPGIPSPRIISSVVVDGTKT